MKRRRFLRTAPVAGLVGISGCNDDQVESESPSTTRTEQTQTPEQEPTATDTEDESTEEQTSKIPLPWNRMNGPPGGPVTDISISAADTDYLYATTETAGLYASADGGESWIQGPESAHHRQGIFASPHDPEIARGKINRTTDAGQTWFTESYRPEDLRRPDPEQSRTLTYSYDPFNENIIYAGTLDGIYRTEDRGSTWERAELDIEIDSSIVTEIETASEREGRVFAAFYQDGTIVRSDDHGETWQPIPGSDDLPRNAIRGLVSNSKGNTVYVAIDGNGIYKIADGSAQNVAPNTGSPYFLFYDGIMLSADGERLYFHSFSLEETSPENIWGDMELYEYDDATGEVSTVEVPEKHSCVTTHPTEPSTLFFGGWSWVWKSTDQGNSWAKLSNKFTDRYLAAVETNNSHSGTVIPGSICSTGITVSHDLGETWHWKRSGLDRYHDKGEFNEHYVMQIRAVGDRVYATTAAGLLISEDNGSSWRLLYNDFSGGGNIAGGGSGAAKHLHGLGVNPKDSSVVYVGTGIGDAGPRKSFFEGETLLWKSSDGGNSWQQITTGFPSQKDRTVQDILVSKHDTDTVYVGTNTDDYIGSVSGSGIGVFKSTNAGGKWEQLDTPFANIHSLCEDAADQNTVFASSPRGVFRTTDGGSNWEEVLSHETKALLTHPNKSDILFAGAQKYDSYWDLLVSEDSGESWSEGDLTIQVGQGLDEREYDGIDRNAYKGSCCEYGEIIDLAMDTASSTLIAATRGASLWDADIRSLE